MTRRQILLQQRAIERRRNRARADMVEAVGVAFGGSAASTIRKLRGED